MRLCRYTHNKQTQVGLYEDKTIIPLAAAAKAYGDATHDKPALPAGDDLVPLLPPTGPAYAAVKKVADWAARNDSGMIAALRVPTDKVELLVPIARPNAIYLLAGNYNAHITEGGGAAIERAETFPYVFMKPPCATLTDPNKPVVIPKVSPDHIDWELELGVVIGRRARHVAAADALGYVAGYVVCNDISDRVYRPNPGRKERPKDSFFDWQHGKWHDTFLPCGPCVTTADAIADPQALKMKLSVNGAVKQDATTAQQIFTVAQVVEFLSHIATLQPGDIISTGTPAGVGHATKTYFKPGDKCEAWIEGIGTLVSPIVAESA
jgi:2-keto-4-pentenoate hydratase/2-oxohepta-3-ene-1,7-dioic acid hydratase in catechol pathway